MDLPPEGVTQRAVHQTMTLKARLAEKLLADDPGDKMHVVVRVDPNAGFGHRLLNAGFD